MSSFLAPYAADHKYLNGEGDARPTALKVIRDQDLEGKLGGKVFLITGGTGGIGYQTARAIHATGADVYITGQNREKGENAVKSLTVDGKPGKVVFLEMYLDSLENIRQVASEFLELSGGKLNVLICNAGVRGYPKDQTKDGFEQHFGINHLGHFALFQAVKDALISSSTPSYNSRVVCLSAQGHRQSKIRFGDYFFDNNPEEYQPLLAYAQSKTANIYMALEVDRRFSAQGVRGLAAHPGIILGTDLNRKTPADQMAALAQNPAIQANLKNSKQGAATTVWAATAREWEGKGGKFLEDVSESQPFDVNSPPLSPGYAEHVYDAEAASRLWDESVKMIQTAA
ncbi:putative short-chain dehydrogenase [Talaromyces proteolyticus]|uniref:Short-chain dehydrogenase n=1 Tax=Talaromyces proteolyticus TaxID=1131652 RepID=A0AAD4KYZ4_9EURO|nr:putative short-chain dehydrogenase [Talaromyces proteolyticus]KAH8703193.1 putative short-chain dehydrogenase [Talaromyces proteolyticus]